MTWKKAIVVFLKKYDYAVTQEWIINKVAWALYQTWKEADKGEAECSHTQRNLETQ